jgi:ubiquinone/menaquinone biosynthesis C-methylase UbiE
MIETVDSYDQIAARFVAQWGSLRLERALNAFVARMATRRTGQRRVLDLGCGPGRDAGYLAQLGYWVVGLDLSSRMLAEAWRRLPTARFVQADLRCPPLASSSFDGVWACASLLHLPRSRMPGALREIARLLQVPGGVFYLALKGGEGEGWFADQDGRRRFFSFYQPAEIEKMLSHTGFQILEVWVAPDQAGREHPWINIIACA